MLHGGQDRGRPSPTARQPEGRGLEEQVMACTGVPAESGCGEITCRIPPVDVEVCIAAGASSSTLRELPRAQRLGEAVTGVLDVS